MAKNIFGIEETKQNNDMGVASATPDYERKSFADTAKDIGIGVAKSVAKGTIGAIATPVISFLEAKQYNDSIPEKTETWKEQGTIGKVKTLEANFLLSGAKTFEDAGDAVLGVAASIFGNKGKEISRDILEKDLINKKALDESVYDWGSGWKGAYDLSGGLGGVAGQIGAGYALGGLGLGAKAAQVGKNAFLFSSAMGSATKEAMNESGNLGIAEWGYGAGNGILEVALEGLEGVLHVGSGKLINKAVGKTLIEATDVGGKTAIKNVAKDMLSEGLQEGIQTFLDPYMQKITYNQNADLTHDWGEIGYSALIGALTGGIMSGATSGIQTTALIKRGREISESGKANSVIETSKAIIENASDTALENRYLKPLKDTYNALTESMANTGGNIATLTQQSRLAQLSTLNATAAIMPSVELGLVTSVKNAERVADAYSKLLGQEITADILTKGIDFNNEQTIRDSALKQMEKNPILAQISMMEGVELASRLNDAKAQTEANIDAVVSQFLDELDASAMSEQDRAKVFEFLGADADGNVDVDNAKGKIYELISEGYLNDVKELESYFDNIDNIKDWNNDSKDGLYSVKTNTGRNIFILKNKKGYRIVDIDGDWSSKVFSNSDQINDFIKNVYENEQNNDVINKRYEEIKAKNDEINLETNEVTGQTDVSETKVKETKHKKPDKEYKRYTKKEVNDLIIKLEESLYTSEDGTVDASLKGKSRKEIVDTLFHRVNLDISSKDQKALIDNVARVLVDNAYIGTLYADGENAASITSANRSEQIEMVKKEIANFIDNGGRKLTKIDGHYTDSTDFINQMYDRLTYLEAENINTAKRNNLNNSIAFNLKKIKDAMVRKTAPASEFRDGTFDFIDKALTGMLYKGNISETKVKQNVRMLEKWIVDTNPILIDACDLTEDGKAVIPSLVLDALDILKESAYVKVESDSNIGFDFKLNSAGERILNDAKLTVDAYEALDRIVKYVNSVRSQYNTITLNGVKENLTDSATKFINIAKLTPELKGLRYTFDMADPTTFFNAIEHWDKEGGLSRAFRDIKLGESRAKADNIRLIRDIDTLFKENPKYYKQLKRGTVVFKGQKIKKSQYLTLYQLSKRDQAKLGLVKTGAKFTRKGNYVKLDGIIREIDDPDVRGGKLFVADITENFDKITELDRKYLSLVDKLMNVDARNMKKDTDIKMQGFSNAEDGFYFSIVRDNLSIATSTTKARTSISAVMDASNKSFNMNVKKNAANGLFCGDIDNIVRNHAKGVADYANLAIPMKNWDRILNKNIGTRENPQNLMNTICRDVYNETVNGKDDNQNYFFRQYVSNLMLDIQGARPHISDAAESNFMAHIRKTATMFTLGGNVPVMVGQFASYPMVIPYFGNEIAMSALAQNVNYDELYKWSDYAYARMYDGDLALAEANVGALSTGVNQALDASHKIAKACYSGINSMDKFTIGKIWNCAKLQAAKEGLKVGTDEYFRRSAEILEEVSRKTQPNYLASERSGWQRSESHIKKIATMFSSAPMKEYSRIVESTLKFDYARKTSDVKLQKEAKSEFLKTIGAVTTSTLMLVTIKKAFKELFKQDDKEGIEDVKDFVSTFLVTLVGICPAASMLTNAIKGYDTTDFGLSAANKAFDGIRSAIDILNKAWLGEPIETYQIIKAFESFIDGVNIITTGIPSKNIRKLFQGVLDRFFPVEGYAFSDLRLAKSYGTDVTKALQSGDEILAASIIDRATKGRLGTTSNAQTIDEITRLYENGYDGVLPKSIHKTVSYTDEEGNKQTVKLNSKQYKAFKQTYGKASSVVDTMVTSKAFLSLSDEAKAKAIKGVYDGYYAMALDEVTGQGVSNKYGYLASIGLTDAKYSVALAGINTQNSVKGADGRTVSGSKKANTIKYLNTVNLTDGERLFLLTYSGYSLTEGDYKGMSKAWQSAKLYKYITTLNVDNATKLDLAVSCGLEVKNGKIVVPSGVVKKFKTVV